MDCHPAQDQLELAALDGLPAAVQEDVMAHVTACPSCREAWEECQAALAAIRSSVAPAQPRHAFRLTVQEAVSGEMRQARNRRRAWRAFVAASAAAALVLAVAGWHWTAGRATRPAPDSVPRMAATERWQIDGAMAVRSAPSGGVTVQASRTYFVRRAPEGTRIAAVDVETGRALWETPIDAIGQLASDASRVYGLSGGGGRPVDLVALDAASGEIRWRYGAVARRALEGYGKPAPLAPDRVCWTAGTGVHWLDSDTGRPIWTRAFDDERRISTPASADGRLYVAGTQALHGLDLDSGAALWTCPLGVAREAVASRPLLAVGGGRAYVAAPGPRQASRLTCVRLSDQRVLWSRAIPWPHHLLATDEGPYVRAAEVLAFDGASGAPRWSRSAGGCGPLTADDGLVQLVDSSHAGRFLALERQTGRPAWELPGIRSCELFYRAGELGVVETVDGVLRAFSFSPEAIPRRRAG
jgi:outer membrane protein assembly factor BamB